MIKMDEFNEQEIASEMSWAKEGLFFRGKMPDYNETIFNKFLFEKYPMKISKHCSEKEVIDMFNEYVGKKDFHVGLDLIRHLYWKFLLLDERGYYLSEQVMKVQREKILLIKELELLKNKLDSQKDSSKSQEKE